MSTDNNETQELAEELHDELDSELIDTSVEDLEARFEQYIKYDVEPQSAKQTIVRNLASEAGVQISEAMGKGSGSSEFVKVEDVTEPDEFVNMNVTISDLWDNDTDSISQVGVAHDDTGRIKFVSWAKSELPLLTEGQSYQLKAVATDEYKGRMSISLNSRTDVKMIDDEFEAPDNTKEFTGTLVKIHDGSGLIRRCPKEDCNRVLQNGECPEHGDVDGKFDLRIRGVLDNGKMTQNVNFGRELSEVITGINLEKAKSMAQSALDTTVVGKEMADEIIGNYYTVSGWENEREFLMVNEVDDANLITSEKVSELVTRMDALEPMYVDDESDGDDDEFEEQWDEYTEATN